jgi:glycerol uptake facilitator protein
VPRHPSRTVLCRILHLLICSLNTLILTLRHPITTQIAFLAEAMGTGILSFVIFALTNPKNDAMKTCFVPPLIGLTVGALIAVFAPLTQAGFNPARDFGPRIVAFFAGWKDVAFKGCWVYILAPILGAVVGAVVADKVLYADD